MPWGPMIWPTHWYWSSRNGRSGCGPAKVSCTVLGPVTVAEVSPARNAPWGPLADLKYSSELATAWGVTAEPSLKVTPWRMVRLNFELFDPGT